MAFPDILKKLPPRDTLQAGYSGLDQSSSTNKPDTLNAPAPAESITLNFSKFGMKNTPVLAHGSLTL